MSTPAPNPRDALNVLLRTLKLPSFATSCEELAARGDREGWSFLQYLYELAQQEVVDRKARRIERLQRQSGLPADKTLSTLETSRLPSPVRRRLSSLCDGDFLRDATNVLTFGLPGRGKTHVACAIGHELVRRGSSVLFTPTYKLVEQLLAAKRELTLERMLRRLDTFDAVILDDIGYVQQGKDEMEVLFTFLAERYERRSVIITSNLVFSEWNKIFKDPMTTAAAIDRVVHHSVILEMTGQSFRADEAAKRNKKKPHDQDDMEAQ